MPQTKTTGKSLGRIPENLVPLLVALRQYKASVKSVEALHTNTKALALAVHGEQLANQLGMFLVTQVIPPIPSESESPHG